MRDLCPGDFGVTENKIYLNIYKGVIVVETTPLLLITEL